jgi:hypothetical protein
MRIIRGAYWTRLGKMRQWRRAVRERLNTGCRRARIGPRGFERESLRIHAVGGEARPDPHPPHEYESRREPPHPDPLLHKCVGEREMSDAALNGSNPVKPSQTCGWGSGQWLVVSGQWPVVGGGTLIGQTESNQIKPAGVGEEKWLAAGGQCCMPAIQASQTESNPVKPAGVGEEKSPVACGRCCMPGMPHSQTESNRIKPAGGVAELHGLAGARPSRKRAAKCCPVKPSQTCGWGSGKWQVASGRWRKRVGQDCPVKPSQSQSNQRAVWPPRFDLKLDYP